jgi:predicted nuclease of predicted toxin-antitoxin system
MFRLLADKDFDNDIVRGLLLRRPELDIVRVQDSRLAGEEDPIVLEWAAQERRIVLTHDFNTMPVSASVRQDRSPSFLDHG